MVSNKGAKKICTHIDNDIVPWGYGVDFCVNKIARDIGLEVYWAEPTIVIQGSQCGYNPTTIRSHDSVYVKDCDWLKDVKYK